MVGIYKDVAVVDGVSVTHREPPSYRGTPVSTKVADAVAEAEDIDPTALSPPLYEAIDTTALNDLIPTTTSPGSAVRVSFAYHGYDITVYGDGHVALNEGSE